MASDIPAPQDDSHLHDDPAELAREHQREADAAWGEVGVKMGAIARFEHHQRLADRYFRMAARGECVPRF